MTKTHDIVVVGGGLVGLATARALLEARPGLSLTVLEAEGDVAPHQSGHNSGVLHSGLYYVPGSAKARLCLEGRERMVRFCGERGIAHAISGKLVVATRADQLPRLDTLAERAAANGLDGVACLGPEGIREHEPHATGLAALFVPQAGVVDYTGAARAMAREIEAAGGTVHTGARLEGLTRADGHLVLETESGEVRARFLVACAGLEADRVARLAGLEPEVSIVPFRGDYVELVPERRELVRALVYPVPDPRFPFLGVHFTRRVDGRVEVGPNAVVAFSRSTYSRVALSLDDARETLAFPGFWRFVGRHLGTAVSELRRGFSPSEFAAAARELVPDLRDDDLVPAGCGIRAQAMREDGALVDDFAFAEGESMLHVLNAPSPAATACLAIGGEIARKVAARLA